MVIVPNKFGDDARYKHNVMCYGIVTYNKSAHAHETRTRAQITPCGHIAWARSRHFLKHITILF